MAEQQQQQQQQQETSQQQQQQRKKVTLEELYLQVRDKPCRVADIRIEGHQRGSDPEQQKQQQQSAAKPLRLKQEILDRELDRVYEAKTLKEVHEALERSVEVLRQLEVFDDITAVIGAEPKDDADSCSIDLDLTESNWYRYKAGTYTQGGEYSLEVLAACRNVLGVADQWSLTGEIGTRNSRNFAASFRLPRAGGSPLTPEVRVAQVFNNQQLHSSWEEALRGINISLVSADHPGLFLGYEYGWRKLSANTKASRAVQSQAGDYLKAALKAGYTWQTGGWRRGETLPTEGYQMRVSGELGGAAPGAASLQYLRTQTHISWAAALADGLSFHVEAGTGLLLPCWSGGPEGLTKPTPLPERFYLGGIESNLRGFETRGVGPSEPRRLSRRRDGGSSAGGSGGSGGGGAAAAAATTAAAGGSGGYDGIVRDALGGDVFANLYTALMVRLPGQAGDLGAHAHVFANGGSSMLLSSSGSQPPAAEGAAAGSSGSSGGLLRAVGQRLREGSQQLGSSFRWSAGVGLVLPMTLGRLEFNYCWVLTSQEHDRVKRGFSFGFAANMGL